MSDKDRQKKDGRDKNKKIQARREDHPNPPEKKARSAQQSTGVVSRSGAGKEGERG
ncbi:MAG TPA: hypothetical protein VFD58_05135 [Blastocatellia bacterium]|nr:hypothetical protein [Blastocatellia bacterium]